MTAPKRLVAFALLAGAPASSAYADVADYAKAWQLTIDPGRGAYRLELTEPVYAALVDPALRDFVVLDAQGRAVPLAPAPAESARFERRRGGPAPFFPLAASADPREDIRLRIERDDQGRLRAAQTDVRATTAGEDPEAPDPRTRYVIDASTFVPDRDATLAALHLEWRERDSSAQATYAVDASDDLHAWKPVGRGTLVDLRRPGELPLKQAAIAFDAPVRERYLRLVPIDSRAAFEIVRVDVTVERRAADTPRAQPVVRAIGETAAREPGVHVYTIPGLMPIDRVRLALPDGASSAHIELGSRSDDASPWTPRASFTAFRIGAAASTEQPVVHERPALAGVRDRTWRVESTPPLAGAPDLSFEYRPDAYVFLEQGPGPYVLAAGSRRATRVDASLAEPLAALRRTYGASWRPARVEPGAEIPAGGALALVEPTRPTDVRRYGLWAVLVLGALVVVALVLKLMREPRAT